MQVHNILATKGTNVITVRPDQTVREVVGLLAEYNVGALVVADSDLHCIGIISERDIVRRAAVDEDVFSLPVIDVMTSEVIIANMQHDLRPVAHTMLEKRIRHLPIVEDGRVMGIISIRDVLKAQRDQFQGKIETITLQLLAEEEAPQKIYGHAVQAREETRAPKQGDVALLKDPVAQQLLQVKGPAHLAYTWRDGTPRVIPMGFHWNGQEIVMASVADAPKTKVLTTGSKVAVSIERDYAASQILFVRGTIRADTVEGIAPEYATMIRRTMSEQDAAELLKEAALLYRRMTRFFIHPDWVGILDFETRLPSAVERAMKRATNRHND
jgi:CBS domain-containing protein